jgi:hypothetical protein
MLAMLKLGASYSLPLFCLNCKTRLVFMIYELRLLRRFAPLLSCGAVLRCLGYDMVCSGILGCSLGFVAVLFFLASCRFDVASVV